jgi:hypothetical protein
VAELGLSEAIEQIRQELLEPPLDRDGNPVKVSRRSSHLPG